MNDEQFLDLAINTLEKIDENLFDYSKIFDNHDNHNEDCKRCILGQIVLDNNLNKPRIVNHTSAYLTLNKEFFDTVSNKMFRAVVLGEFDRYGVKELYSYQEDYSKQEVLECLNKIKRINL